MPPFSDLTCHCVPHFSPHLPIPPFPDAQPHVNCPKITCVACLPLNRFHCDYGLVVDTRLVSGLLEHLSQRIGLGACSPFMLVQSLHGCALLRHVPPRPWTESFLAHVGQRLPELSAADLSNVLWALATLGVEPGWLWVDAALARCEAETRGFGTGTMLASTLWAVAALRHAPSGAWMEHFTWQVGGGGRF